MPAIAIVVWQKPLRSTRQLHIPVLQSMRLLSLLLGLQVPNLGVSGGGGGGGLLGIPSGGYGVGWDGDGDGADGGGGGGGG